MELQPETITADDILEEIYTLHISKNAFSETATDEIQKRISSAVSEETYYQIEPMTNELFDCGAREGFKAGFRAAITLLQSK